MIGPSAQAVVLVVVVLVEVEDVLEVVVGVEGQAVVVVVVVTTVRVARRAVVVVLVVERRGTTVVVVVAGTGSMPCSRNWPSNVPTRASLASTRPRNLRFIPDCRWLDQPSKPTARTSTRTAITKPNTRASALGTTPLIQLAGQVIPKQALFFGGLMVAGRRR